LMKVQAVAELSPTCLYPKSVNLSHKQEQRG
jgi:hypothetical protein